MNINAKCCCGATIELAADTVMYGGGSSYDQGKIHEVFEKWAEKHRACAELMTRKPLDGFYSGPVTEFKMERPVFAEGGIPLK